MPTVFDQFFFGVLPYIALVLFIGVQAIRWVALRFGWTAKSSQLFEKQMLGIVSVIFHYAIILLLAVHILGIISGFVPPRALLQIFYVVGTIAASVALYALMVALIRRITVREVRAMSISEDYIILIFLILILSIGLYQATIAGVFGIFPLVSRWLQTVFIGAPQIELIADLPLLNKIHIIIALLFISYWPFTKIAGMLAFPITYAWRRYQVMRRPRKIFR